MKKCSKCGAEKAFTEFNKCLDAWNGVQAYCRPCAKAAYLADYPPKPRDARGNRDRGAAGEHFVIHWLLVRGFETGGPYNPQGAHDLFVKLGTWHTVQVKVVRVSQKTGNISISYTKKRVTSDLVALVDLAGGRIRWISNTSAPLPPELANET